MCGRYDNLIPRDAYAALFRPVRVPRSNFPPRYNVAPTDQIPSFASIRGTASASLRWPGGVSFHFG
jgi:putative SOS response-associated peptidase YedK